MSAIKTYFKQEWNFAMLGLRHPKPSDFYLSVWQTNRSAVPLLIFRTLLFLLTLAIVVTSFVFYILNNVQGYWFIYLTHWGLTLILLTTGFASFLSARCYIKGPLSAEFVLPWYVKVFWILYNIAIPIAFLITIFYWTLLFDGIEEEYNHGLDISVHGLNSLVVVLLLLSSSLPARCLHIYHPVCFSFMFVFFSIIYYLAGGTDQYGNAYIYPVVDWSSPLPTTGLVLMTGLLLAVLYLITILMACARDATAKYLVKPSVIVHIEEGVPLRSQTRLNANVS